MKLLKKNNIHPTMNIFLLCRATFLSCLPKYSGTCFGLLAICCLLFAPTNLLATHNRAGEITYQNAPLPGQPYRFIFSIHTYTRASGGGSESADRDTLPIKFGDGTEASAPRVNGGAGTNGELIGNNVKYNRYEVEHNYPGPFTYVVSVQDPNRVEDIINIQFGASVEVPFYLEDTLFVRDPQFFGYNNSPILYQPPIDFANVGYPFIHNPNAFDADGDSLVFSFTTPLANQGVPVPAFQTPDQITPGANNNLSIDPSNGEIWWNAPQQAGIYNIAILIEEYRNGLIIGTLIRDMQIIVKDVNNRPPNLNAINDTCVVVGEVLQINITASDPDNGQQVRLTAFGSPLDAAISPAIFNANPSPANPAGGQFIWATTCDHIFSEQYIVVFKAEDSFMSQGAPLPLSDLETWQIQVIAPAPTEVQANIVAGQIELNWNLTTPYLCQNNPKFRGFSVWRSIGCDSLDIPRCQLGLAGTSYTQIAENIQGNTYTDLSAVRGVRYAYRIVAEFADAFTQSVPPTPINAVSSMASGNVCIELPKDAPIITNVSVESTQTNNGQIDIAWSKPRPIPLDTTINLPPYRYELYRSEGIATANFSLVQNWTYNQFYLANDTTYSDNSAALNTQDQAYTYKIAFYANNILIDETQTASSVRLSANPIDNAVQLSWTFNVPWLNYSYEVYKQNTSGAFDLIATVPDTQYTDQNLINGTNYCYYIRAIGTYGSDELIDPLLNKSQIACATPRDTQAPCATTLSVANGCDADITEPNIPLVNNLTWQNPNLSCANDVVAYRLYYQAPLSATFELIAAIEGANTTAYPHNLNGSLAGCYYVTAIDSFQNESLQSNIVCAENCLDYELPNAFTPNNDGDNDKFVPRRSRFVSQIDLKIFNRWGNLVFETQNPLIDWNGTESSSGKDIPDGVYYYVCDVYEQTYSGAAILNKQLNGYIHLIR
jgi:gliding motility-associated-like protein